MSKLINLENLAIRNFNMITDQNVIRLVHNLPRLRLLDLSRCPKITRASVSLLENYSQAHQRQIKFIYTDEKLNLPQPVVCQDFDFMKNCFHRNFNDLPQLEGFHTSSN